MMAWYATIIGPQLVFVDEHHSYTGARRVTLGESSSRILRQNRGDSSVQCSCNVERCRSAFKGTHLTILMILSPIANFVCMLRSTLLGKMRQFRSILRKLFLMHYCCKVGFSQCYWRKLDCANVALSVSVKQVGTVVGRIKNLGCHPRSQRNLWSGRDCLLLSRVPISCLGMSVLTRSGFFFGGRHELYTQRDDQRSFNWITSDKRREHTCVSLCSHFPASSRTTRLLYTHKTLADPRQQLYLQNTTNIPSVLYWSRNPLSRNVSKNIIMPGKSILFLFMNHKHPNFPNISENLKNRQISNKKQSAPRENMFFGTLSLSRYFLELAKYNEPPRKYTQQ